MLVIRVQDKEFHHRVDKNPRNLEVRVHRILEHHIQEVLDEAYVLVWAHDRQADASPERDRSQDRHFGDELDGCLLSVLGVTHVLQSHEAGETGDDAAQFCHGVRVMMEPIIHIMDLLMYKHLTLNPLVKHLKLVCSGPVAIEKNVADLDV